MFSNKLSDTLFDTLHCEFHLPITDMSLNSYIDVHNSAYGIESSVFEYFKYIRGSQDIIWKIKAKLSERGYLGVYITPRILFRDHVTFFREAEDLSYEELLKNFGLFKTVSYTIEVFNKFKSKYTFPMTESYSFGPSNIVKVQNLLNHCIENNQTSLDVQVKLTENPLHSIIMHHIGINFSKYMGNISSQNLKKFQYKQLLSFYECDKVVEQLESLEQLTLLDRYVRLMKLDWNKMTDLIKTFDTRMTEGQLSDLFQKYEQHLTNTYGTRVAEMNSIIFCPEFEARVRLPVQSQS